jgi:hypothetical protein
VIYWSDETGVCNQDQNGNGYAPKKDRRRSYYNADRTEVLDENDRRRGQLIRFKLYKGALNVGDLRFHQASRKGCEAKVFLIVDNLRVHNAKVQDSLAQHRDEIEIFYLSAYAPEDNPNQYLNSDVQQTIKSMPRAKTRDDLVATTSLILNPSREVQRGSSHTSTQNMRATQSTSTILQAIFRKVFLSLAA